MTDRRNRIGADLMEQLQMLKFSYKSGHHLDFTQGTSEKDALQSLEEAIDGQECVAEDIHTFLQSLSM